MPTVLVIGGSRGLGHALVHALSQRNYTVYTTVRSLQPSGQNQFPPSVHVIPEIELSDESCSRKIVEGLKGSVKLDLCIYSAGVFEPSALYKADSFNSDARFIMITTEGGSITLRTKEEGGGNYAHHASKAAQNMIARLLSLDLAKAGVTTVALHPGFLRTEMTANIGFDQFYDSGGAVEADVAAVSLIDFVERITPSHNGQFWAPRGARDIGQAKRVMGDEVSQNSPIQLPW